MNEKGRLGIPIKLPLIPQNILEDMLVHITMNAVDRIVRRHQRPRLPISDCHLKRTQVQLPEWPLCNSNIHRHAPGFLLIGNVVLDGSCNAFPLETLDVCGGEFSGKIWILGERLEITSTKWRSVQAHCWA